MIGVRMAWDKGIEGVHKEIAASDSRRIGVLAGPGTGKTSFGLMRRVVRLLESGVPANRILLLSFTRVAAADLRDKVAALDAPGAEEVRATTLHAFCFGLLQQESVLTITRRSPRILLDHEVDLMLRDIGGDFGNIHERRRRREAYVAGWARSSGDYPGAPEGSKDREFQEAVRHWLRRHRAMLIGEVVPQAYQFLNMNPQAEALYAFDHVIVDEYQDLNALEQQLLDVLAQYGSLCIAGDDDQSIYSVRYANPEGILTYLACEDVEGYSIQICGRCPENILVVANTLIGCAPDRVKAPLSVREETAAGMLSIIQWPNTDTEVDGIVAAITGDVTSGKWNPGQVLVLTNWRKIGERIRDRLTALDIPARTFFTEEAVSFDKSKEALALLRLVVDEDDAPALRVILGLGDAGGRSKAYQHLLAFSDANRVDPKTVLQRLSDGEKLGVNVRALIERYSRAMGQVERLRAVALPELVDELFPADTDALADLRSVAIESLAEAETAADLLRSIVEAVTQDDVPQNPDFVRVMSLHKSKGLTSNSVYIVAAVDGILPTISSDDAGTIEAAEREGRRLFYVAVTRAASELTISGAISMDLADAHSRGVRYDKSTIRRYGDRYTVKTIASPYLSELGPMAPQPVTGQSWLKDR
ncbi:DNA helicase PcrA [soil metagenome]